MAAWHERRGDRGPLNVGLLGGCAGCILVWAIVVVIVWYLVR